MDLGLLICGNNEIPMREQNGERFTQEAQRGSGVDERLWASFILFMSAITSPFDFRTPHC